MRKFLLASAATLGAGGLMVAAFAQAPTAAVGAPLQGQMAYPMANPIPSVNNNSRQHCRVRSQTLRRARSSSI
jgi:hypothetical protein